MLKRVLCVFLASLVASLAPSRAHAFKLKTHVMTANRALKGVSSDGKISFEGFPTPVRVDADVLSAIREFPNYFRAGAVGPDMFPDMLQGQMYVHSDNGDNSYPLSQAMNVAYVSPSAAFETRKVAGWRSIDYGMNMLRAARTYSEPNNPSARKQAIAFAYGYLAHMAGDGFAHSWVNEWASGAWHLDAGGGMYGIWTEELKHLAVEGYLDMLARPDSISEFNMSAPIGFLRSVYEGRADQGSNGLSAAGAVGGPIHEELVSIRNELRRLSDHNRWNLPAAVKTGLSIHSELANFASFGTGIGDPIADIEDFFSRRATMIDGLLGAWINLSMCTTTNMVYGAAYEGQPVTEDDCQDASFEYDPEVYALFKGSLDAAIKQPARDYGGVSANMQKYLAAVGEVSSKFLKVDPIDDIRSVRLLSGVALGCGEGLEAIANEISAETGEVVEDVDRICERACDTVSGTCEEVIGKTACLGCPTSGGNYSCSGWRKGARCGLMPQCIGCVGFEKARVNEFACDVLADVTLAGACSFCTETPLCEVTEKLQVFDKAIKDALYGAIEPALKNLMKKAAERIAKAYLGPEYQKLVEAYRVFEAHKYEGQGAWLINTAFLAEDLAYDPAYLVELLSNGLGIARSTLDASNDLYAATRDRARARVAQAVAVVDTVYGDALWRQLIGVLQAMSRGDVNAIKNAPGNFLDTFRFKNGDRPYADRALTLVELLNRLGLVADTRGPTARALRMSFGLSDSPNAVGERVAIDDFWVTKNAIELIKLGLLGRVGLEELMAGSGAPSWPSYASQICNDYPHVLCDSLRMLDDPNYHGQNQPVSTMHPGGNGFWYYRSVAGWESRNVLWRGVISPQGCEPGYTPFSLLRGPAALSNVYSRLFQPGAACQTPAPLAHTATNLPHLVQQVVNLF